MALAAALICIISSCMQLGRHAPDDVSIVDAPILTRERAGALASRPFHMRNGGGEEYIYI